MAFIITVTGTFRQTDNVTPAVGSVEFVLTGAMQDGTRIYSPVPQIALLDSLGRIALPLVATTDPAMQPQGRGYWVRPRISGVETRQEWLLIVPWDAPGATLDLSTSVPAQTTQLWGYTLLTTFNAHQAHHPPAGGTTGQGLRKRSNSDYDWGWDPAPLPGGPPPPQTGGRPFPPDNLFYQDTSARPVHASNAAWMALIDPAATASPGFLPGVYLGQHTGFHPTAIPDSQPHVAVTQLNPDWFPDSTTYPIPPAVLIQGYPIDAGDRHVLLWQAGASRLWELWHATKISDSLWQAGFGCVWDTTSNTLRPAGYTSAAASGTPMWPLITTYAEVLAGLVPHAVGLTLLNVGASYIWPAGHTDGVTVGAAPMGAYLRLKATADLSGVAAFMLPLCTAMQTYGCVIVDTGDNLAVWGESNDLWDLTQVESLRTLTRDMFEFIDVAGLMVSPDSLGTTVPVPPSTGGGHVIADEGSALAAQPTLNFIGPGVTATNNAGATRTDVTIPGGSGHVIAGGGFGLPAQPILNFTSTGITASNNVGASRTDVSLSAASTADPGSMSAADFTKLDGVATGATANSPDATLLARANHTGTQAASTISDFAEATDDRVAALLVAGTNITLTYDDPGNTLTVAASGGGGGGGAATGACIRSGAYSNWELDEYNARGGFTLNELLAVPFPVGVGGAVDQLALKVWSGGDSGCLVRLGLYADNGAGLPGALVADGGTIDGTNNITHTVPISATLTPGLYWFAAVVQGTTTNLNLMVHKFGLPWVHGTSVPTSGNYSAYVSPTSTPGALPGTFGAPSGVSALAPRIFVRGA